MTPTMIPMENWQSFCEEFSRRHQGERAMISVIDSRRLQLEPDLLDDPLAVVEHNAPFRRIVADQKGEHHLELQIEAGEESDPHNLVLVAPQQLRVEQTDSGDECGLRIDEPAGRTTVVRFHTNGGPESSGSMTET